MRDNKIELNHELKKKMSRKVAKKYYPCGISLPVVITAIFFIRGAVNKLR